MFVLLSVNLPAVDLLIDRESRMDYDQPDHVIDRAELIALYEVMESLINNTNWRKDHPHPCTFNPWPGIECEQRKDYMLHVTKIQVDGSNPKSKCKSDALLSTSISKLPHLKSFVIISCFLTVKTNILSGRYPPSLEALTLRGNSALSGSIPKELGSLKNLQILSLSQNNLQATIPSELGALGKLQSLDLSYNNLTGVIPKDLGLLVSLSIIDLSNNQLQGNIPDDIGKLVHLKKIDFSSNQIRGIIPPSIGSINTLQFLALNRNFLTGGLPATLSSLTNIQYLILQDNPMHTSIPDFWSGFQSLREVKLSNSGYIGTIPSTICNLGNLSELALDKNLLTGNIPDMLGNMPNMYHLNLSDNQLTGSVSFPPTFYNRLGGNLDLHGNTGLCSKTATSMMYLRPCNFKSSGCLLSCEVTIFFSLLLLLIFSDLTIICKM